jgi:hypothetical protein
MAVHTDAIGARRSAGTEPIRPDVIFRVTSMTRPVTAAHSSSDHAACLAGIGRAHNTLWGEMRVLARRGP